MHATYYEALDTTALPQGVLPAIFLSMEQRLADLLELKISSEAVGSKGSCCAFAVGLACAASACTACSRQARKTCVQHLGSLPLLAPLQNQSR